MATVLVTGGAGFIGAHVARLLLRRGDRVVVLDNFNDYYDPALKEARVAQLLGEFHPTIVRADLSDAQAVAQLFAEHQFDAVCHLAAQAGVRYSITNPRAYVQSNVVGTLNVLEQVRTHGKPYLVFASSSSVYGDNAKVPFSEDDPVTHPVSLYAATKRATELLAFAYHRLHGLHCTGVRLFTVYGPWGRPDMAYFSFTRALLANEPIQLYNRGQMERDLTYVDDVAAGIVVALDRRLPGCEIINLGNSHPIPLASMVAALEAALNVKARTELAPMQPGDVVRTYADVSKAKRLLGWEPRMAFADGIRQFAAWYRNYYQSSK